MPNVPQETNAPQANVIPFPTAALRQGLPDSIPPEVVLEAMNAPIGVIARFTDTSFRIDVPQGTWWLIKQEAA